MLSHAIGTVGKLRTQHRRFRKLVTKLEDELNGFRVIDAYEHLERRADELQRAIDRLTNENVLDRELVTDIDEALAEEATPEIPEVERLFHEAGVVLPGVSLARYEDVRRFHTAIVANRRAHLLAERQDAARRMELRDEERRSLSDERNRLLEALNSGGALSQYRKLDNELSTKRADLESLAAQLTLAERFESLRGDLKVERADVERRLAMDLQERQELVTNAMEEFDDISTELYREPSTFEVVSDRRGLDFIIQAVDIASEGVSKMQIYSFDLMLASLCARRGRWPGFLVHDSHIFDGVDGRQIASALDLGHRQAMELIGQYIVTMNSDDLEKAERESQKSFQDFVIRPLLDDTPTGGLFGFRFQTPQEPDTDKTASQDE